MISGSYERTKSGLLVPKSNGFANRMIFRTAGAFSFTLPTWAEDAKLAIIGAGGGGALALMSVATWLSAGGGAGGGFAQKRLTGVGGMTLSGTIGAGGPGGVYASAYTSNFFIGGSNGGTTTATLAGSTLSATGGAGAPLPTTGAVTYAQPGVGSGGDLNNPGGQGGNLTGSFSTQEWAAGGGGASGSPFGPGGRGGNPTKGSDTNQQYGGCGAGGGWGGAGGEGRWEYTTTGGWYFNAGGGSVSPGFYDFQQLNSTTLSSILGGRGTWPIANIDANHSQAATFACTIPLDQRWWDLEDVGGWGGGMSTAAMPRRRGRPNQNMAQSGNTSLIYDGQDGAGGAASAGQGFGTSGGFGGGGGGSSNNQGGSIYVPSSFNMADIQNYFGLVNPGPGGVGGGGGGFAMQGQTSVLQSGTGANLGTPNYFRASDGGNGCAILWY